MLEIFLSTFAENFDFQPSESRLESPLAYHSSLLYLLEISLCIIGYPGSHLSMELLF